MPRKEVTKKTKKKKNIKDGNIIEFARAKNGNVQDT